MEQIKEMIKSHKKGKNGHKNLLSLITHVDSESLFTLVGILSLTIKINSPATRAHSLQTDRHSTWIYSKPPC